MPTPFSTAITASSIFLAGCAAGPPYSPPAHPTARAYTASVASTSDVQGTSRPLPAPSSGPTVVLGSTPREEWWAQLQSPELNRVVSLALKNNLSLEVARNNLAKAQENVNAARGARAPQIDIAGGVERRKYGAYFLGPPARTYPIFPAYTAGPMISYDLDLFGATRYRIQAAEASAYYQQEQLRAARLQVEGDTIIGALHIASVRAQILVVQEVLNADEKTLDLVRAARRAGVISDIDVLQATSQRDQDRTLLPPLYQDLDATKDALSVLIGKAPSEWTPPEFTLDRIALPQELDLVVPSELVHARPDIRAAEAQLREASACVGIATAEMYPQITLSSGWAMEGVLNGGPASAWSLIGGITAPVFHGGTLTAQRRAAQDAYRAAFAQYQLVVLNSFSQVADTLHALDHDAEALEAQRQALSSADSALELTRQGYRVGNADILQILTAQRLRQLADLGRVQAMALQLTDAVRLYLASGDGLNSR
jgi:NodT family efflux transporter outer membrane factor (OMF) lipoprotein